MNQTIITGNLTADIETREIQVRGVGEQQISQFTVACNEGERVIFMPVEAWNMPHLGQYLFKGSKVLLSGALKQDKWETEAGEKRSRIVLTAYKVEFLDPAPAPASSQGSAVGPSRDTPGKRRSRRASARRSAA
ncbi:MAG: single-stranded DNA-binding protein [Opitutales bacterium]